ncbi:MAG: hypothetical protein IT360_01080 [Gemmatimonadaceae bacterium]|nr:hypothetical protein [Gemmatimonadaceae bacterium]
MPTTPNETTAPARTSTPKLQIGLPVVERTPDGRMRIFLHLDDLCFVLIAMGAYLMEHRDHHEVARLKAIGARLMTALDAGDQAVVRECWRDMRATREDAA